MHTLTFNHARRQPARQVGGALLIDTLTLEQSFRLTSQAALPPEQHKSVLYWLWDTVVNYVSLRTGVLHARLFVTPPVTRCLAGFPVTQLTSYYFERELHHNVTHFSEMEFCWSLC